MLFVFTVALAARCRARARRLRRSTTARCSRTTRTSSDSRARWRTATSPNGPATTTRSSDRRRRSSPADGASRGSARRCSPGQLMVAIAGAGAAALTTAVGLHVLRPRWAHRRGRGHGAASVDGAVVVAHAEGRLRLVRARRVWPRRVRARRGRLARVVVVTAIGVGLLVSMDHLRDQTFVVAVWAFAIALVLGGGKPALRERAAIGVAVLVLVPALARLRGRRGVVARRLDPRRRDPTRGKHDRRGDSARLRDDRQATSAGISPIFRVGCLGCHPPALSVGAERRRSG